MDDFTKYYWITFNVKRRNMIDWFLALTLATAKKFAIAQLCIPDNAVHLP